MSPISSPSVAAARQISFDDLGTPLNEVTFCIIDFETTGTSCDHDTITEIGAVKVHAGAEVARFQTLVNPGRLIPPQVTVLTGIAQAMVTTAPRIEAVLPTLLEFIADSVLVAHNARFDMSFLQAALRRSGRDELTNPVIDTVPLSRRLFSDEVTNHRLSTLARHFRLAHRPTHRALDDALATAELLHIVIDRAAALGVRGLDDLRSLPKLANHPQVAKLHLTDRLPRSPGVYLFRTEDGRVLYVGKATNLRTRVRSYFGSDDRRKIGPLLRDTQRIDHKSTSSTLEAEVLEMRLIHHFEPAYNRDGTRWRSSVYVKVDSGRSTAGRSPAGRSPSGSRQPRLIVTAAPKPDDRVVAGPLSSRRIARSFVHAVEQVADRVAEAELNLTTLCEDPTVVVDAFTQRMSELAAEERFEAAAAARDHLGDVASTVERQRLLDSMARCTIEFATPDGHRFLVRRGLLERVWEPSQRAGIDGLDPGRATEAMPTGPGDADRPLRADLADEVLLIGRWLERNGERIRLLRVDGHLASPRTPVPSPGRAPEQSQPEQSQPA
ncbi:MAG: exonuclease domain-containing protein [Microthrixaceae bacterium]